jgi:hypothetical protein
VSREVKVVNKHVNTCSDDLEAQTRVHLRVLQGCYIDRGRLYELSGVKNISVCALEVEIISVHVFAPQHGAFY